MGVYPESDGVALGVFDFLGNLKHLNPESKGVLNGGGAIAEEAGGDKIAVADCVYFIDIVWLAEVIQFTVEVVQHRNQILRL